MADYITEFKHATGNVFVLNLSFAVMPANSDLVLSALKNEIPLFLAKCDGDILATAWYCPDSETEEQIPLPDGSRSLLYRRSDGVIWNWNDYIGETSDRKETDRYFLIVSTQRTFEGIVPAKSWFSVSVLFKNPECALYIYEVLVASCREWAECGEEVHVFPFYGDKMNRLTWKQIRDTDEAYIFVKYDPKTGEITRKGRLLAKL